MYMVIASHAPLVLSRGKLASGFGIVVTVAVCTCFAGAGQSILTPVVQLADGYRQSVNSLRHFQELRKEQEGSLQAVKQGTGETYVLVIGESSARRHYSAYGYFRPTSPWLKSLREDDNAIFFENAYASFCHTVPSLLNALTEANQYNEHVNSTKRDGAFCRYASDLSPREIQHIYVNPENFI